MRVHELAKELGMSSKDLMARIRELGGDVSSHMAVVDVNLLMLIQGKIGPAKGKKEEGEKAPAKSAKAKPKEAEPEAAPVDAAAEEEPEAEPAAPGAPAEKAAVKVRFPITVGNLAALLNIRIPQMIKALMEIGIFANVNQLLNDEIGMAVAEKVEIPIEPVKEEEEEVKKAAVEKPENLKPRPPVVTMMGHVDHGKTSLLDAIRKTKVAAGEHGAITQHIGAYNVSIPGKGFVTFLDTPGHEAFTAMRARGANVTDVVVLVVAADDGIMPQTVEAIDHAREAGCPIVVAINKCDLPAANPEKVLGELQKRDLVPEEWGGKTICVKVSAKTGKGLDQLLEMLLLETEVLELKANPSAPASGTVIEARLSKGSGPVATVIVQRGTLKIGDTVLCGTQIGRVRSLKTDQGKTVKDAGPSFAVQLSGLNGVPEAGEPFMVVEDEKKARQINERRLLEKRERESSASKHLSLETLYQRISEGNFRELKLIIKADVQGSVEALTQSLEKASNDQCRVRVIHGGVGGINESDVMLAAASDAIIIAFHVKTDPKADQLSKKEGVDIHYYHIIYEAVENIRLAMEGLLAPTLEEVIEGQIELRKLFKSSKVGNIGGGMVIKGKVARNNPVRVIRDHIVVFEGKIAALKRFKDDVRDVNEGFECGISLNGFDDIREGDIIESYRIEKTATKLR
ncbi:MAG TPA: translation initiation factor IF-2 [Verrucomicrobiae bacterium]|jgi:translation initiation factor IF-2|nr:translation initiation factor IF-2 [Verrucomicrobiae bacterium]